MAPVGKPRPRSGEEATALARETFGLRGDLGTATPLPSYDDQNWVIASSGAPRYVLKVAAVFAECRGQADAESTRAQLCLENAAMRALHGAGVRVPVPLRARDGVDVVQVPGDGGRGAGDDVAEFVRVLSFERGEHLARVAHTEALLRHLGATVATCSIALRHGLSAADTATSMSRHLTWDLCHCEGARAFLRDVSEADDRALAEQYLDRFAATSSARARLPRQVIHGDLNDYNLLVDDAGAVTLLDFGDIVHSARIYDLAIFLAYVCQNKSSAEEALRAACVVVEGYSATMAERRLAEPTAAELALLHDSICVRLAQSVVTSAHAVKQEPENAEYLSISAEPGWQLMRQWATIPPAVVTAEYRAAAAAGRAAGHRRRGGADESAYSPWLTAALVGLSAALVVGIGVIAARAVSRRMAG